MIQFDNKVTNATLVHYAALQMQFRDNLVNAATAQWTKFLLFFHFPRNFSEQDKAADLKLVTPKTCEISKQEIFSHLTRKKVERYRVSHGKVNSVIRTC